MVLSYGAVIITCVCYVLLCYPVATQASFLDLFSNRLSSGSRGLNSVEPKMHVAKPRSAAMNLIEKYNYPAETHEVETEDGYLITLHRIPRPGKPVALLQHGMLASSDTWLLRGPGQDLAFLLYDEGYDVWLNNARGNVYSRKHISLDPDTDKQFWDYSFHEIGFYDLPAAIDHILNVTEEKSLMYIGHSMGSAAFFVMCSSRPEYNSKINIMHALAPAVFLIHKPSPVWQLILSNTPSFAQSCKEQQIYELFPLKKITSRLGRALCNRTSPVQQFCLAAVFLFTGVDYQQMNISLLPMLFNYYPAGASINTILHFYGNIKSASFRYMDYGEDENRIRYKSKLPPEYNLKKVTAPVALYYGDGDFVVKQDDTETLAVKLPNLISVFKVPFPFFNHIDFLTGTDAKYLLYEHMLRVSQKYQQNIFL